MGPWQNKIIDSDDEANYTWVKWLNPQYTKSYVEARAAARAASRIFAINNDKRAADQLAIDSFGEPQTVKAQVRDLRHTWR